ncbi:MAG: ComF family protein [Burkholderiales bacterium]|nr:ComF family protein [Burkholderiales bacterium]
MLAGALAQLPSQCEVCHAWDAGLVCRACRERHAPARPRCLRCGLALGAPAATCGACQSDPPPYQRTVCALDYGFPWDHLITAFKFQRRVELAAALATLLDEAIEREAGQSLERGAVLVLPQLVVPVPLAPARLAERGFNQAWELARRIARRRRLRARPDALQRVLDTPAQATLASAERRRNLRNAFAPAVSARTRSADRLAGADVALVDDVMTTGATAREAAAALLRDGARSVQLWVLARTPAPAAA